MYGTTSTETTLWPTAPALCSLSPRAATANGHQFQDVPDRDGGYALRVGFLLHISDSHDDPPVRMRGLRHHLRYYRYRDRRHDMEDGTAEGPGHHDIQPSWPDNNDPDHSGLDRALWFARLSKVGRTAH
jgi:hypothetical protein